MKDLVALPIEHRLRGRITYIEPGRIFHDWLDWMTEVRPFAKCTGRRLRDAVIVPRSVAEALALPCKRCF